MTFVLQSPLSISVALCTHNGSKFLEEQLLSILEQRPSPIEIVLSDDASTDDTVGLAISTVEGYRAAHPTVDTELVVLRNEEALGVVRNFEAAMLACRGDLIALSDQDDIWHDGRLAKIQSEFERQPELLLVHSDARLVDEGGTPIGHCLLDALEATTVEKGLLAAGDGFPILIRRNLVTGATVVLRRSLAEDAAPFSQAWIHDEWLAIIGASLGMVRLIPEQLIDYRQHVSNQIGATKPTLRYKLTKLREPRGERNANLVERAVVLEHKLAQFADRVPYSELRGVRKKLAHERFRLSLPRARVLRVVPVLAWALAGKYSRYGRGAIDILRDLTQPADPVGWLG